MVTLRDKYFWIILFVSLAVRIYLGFFTYVIQNDSVAFIRNAESFANGDFTNALRHLYHPLYPLFMAGINTFVQNMEISGTVVSVLFGTLTVVAFYLIGKNAFDRKAAFVSSIILALHPYAVRFSADIISESTYFFFFTSAFGLGFLAISGRKYVLFALAGISAALAYLARPEGIGVILIIIFWCLLKDIVKIKILWKEKLASILIMGIAFFVFSFPYLLFIKYETGAWLLTMKRNLSETKIEMTSDGRSKGKLFKKTVYKDQLSNTNVSNERPKDVKLIKNNIPKQTEKVYLKSFLYIMSKFLSTLHPLLVIFFVIGVIFWTKTGNNRFFGLYLITIIVFYLLILFRLNLLNIAVYGSIDQYPSRRHLMPIVITAIFCVGIGAYSTGTWIYERFKADSLKATNILRQLRKKWIFQLIILIIVVLVLTPKTLKPQGTDKLGIKKVAQWIIQNSDKQSPSIMSTSIRNAYYADGKHMQIMNMNNALSMAREKKADYMLITQRDSEKIENRLQQSIKEKDIELVYKYPETSLDGSTILLYKLHY